jgi:tetratricopeptide (TPR) repeat protein
MQNISPKYQNLLFSQLLPCILLFFYLLFPSHVYAGKEILVNPDEQFLYAEDCFVKKDYINAASEFKRFIFFFPKDERKEPATYKAGLSLYRSGKYQEAIQFFHQFQEEYGDTEFSRNASFLIARSYLAMDRKGDAIISLNNLTMLTKDIRTKDHAYYELGWIWLSQPSYRLSIVENEKHATGYLKKISAEGYDELKIAELENELQKYEALSQKNPIMAGSFSIVPGMGQLYCERYQDSVTAFLLNVAFGVAAFEAFDHENYALGGLISTVGFGFYAGNIYGAVSSAHKYNRNQRANFIELLKQKTRIQIPFKYEDKRFGITFESTF